MKTKLRLVISISIAFLSFYGFAQTNYWQRETTWKGEITPSLEHVDMEKAEVFALDQESISETLMAVSVSKSSYKIIYFPDEKGKIIPFKVSEASVLSPELALRYPKIKSYVGYSMDGRGDRIRVSLSHKGIQGMIVHAGQAKSTFMQKSSDGGNTYLVYSRDSNIPADKNFICSTKSQLEKEEENIPFQLVDDQILRKYRIAVSATGDYTQYHGGTVADALAAINATLTRVNEVFENDLGVTLELIANTDEVIFLDPNTDPYTGNLNTQAQNTLNSIIGAANYDVGHLFDQGSDGGNAGFIGSVCKNNQKGSAYSSGTNPEGDIFDLDFVSHELGHQFGANHTWSFETEGTSVQAEPASGTTIMGYAGIVNGNNVEPNGDDYFHYFSILQISQYLETTNCALEMPLSNNPPEITPIEDFIIPKSTAFVLTGVANDEDASDVLTYTWEQIDDGVVTRNTFGPDRPNGSNFRSFRPTTSPERYFPALNRIVRGNLTQSNPTNGPSWETVSNVERELNFALTVRDNADGGGQVVSDIVKVNVIKNSGPFAVTSQNTTETYEAGSIQNISWDVANTNQPPINAQRVDIYLSTNGGTTFPLLIAEDVANDGSHDILIPGMATSRARIMVKASDNIFLAVNSSNFTIVESEIVLNFDRLDFEACKPDDLVIPFNYETYSGFNSEVTFSTTGLPTGLDANFSPGTAISNNTQVELTLSNTASVATGNYPITVIATSAGVTKEVVLDIGIYDTMFDPITLVSPGDASTDVSLNQLLEWEVDPSADNYEVEISSAANFSNVVESANVILNSYRPTNLEERTTYFWRVKAINTCGEGDFGSPFAFSTIGVNCKTISANGLPLEISNVGTPTVTSKITVVNNLPIADINVNLDINHSFLADLIVTLTSPEGTQVALAYNSCGNLENIKAVFDNEGSNFDCGGSSGISGTKKPLGSLSSLKGESAFGEWTLTIMDTAPADGGVLNGFSLDFCVEGELRPDEDGDGVFDDGNDLCLGTPPNTEVNTDGCPIFRFKPDNFTVAIQSESCSVNNDGSISISAVETLDYTINVSGSGVDETMDFTDNYQLPNLSAGTYTLCITGTDGTVTYEPLCFDAVIKEPEALGVSSKLSSDGLQAILTLTGSNLYNVELNGILTQVETSEVVLDLKNGINELKVSTNLPCQGSYSERIFVSSDPIVYPNPFVERTNIFLGTDISNVDVTIHASNGRLLKRQRQRVVDGKITVDFVEFSSGMYFVSINSEGLKGTYKVLKQ